MNGREAFTWRERRLLRSAARSVGRPRSATLWWYGVLAAVLAWFVWDWLAGVERGEGRTEFIEMLWFIAAALLAIELDTSVRLLARLAPNGTLGPASERTAVIRPTGGHALETLSTPEALRLARAPAYAEYLDSLRWLLPILASGAVGSAVAALACVDIPRPVDLVVAGMAGVSIAAVVAVAALRGWVRLAVALSQRSSTWS